MKLVPSEKSVALTVLTFSWTSILLNNVFATPQGVLYNNKGGVDHEASFQKNAAWSVPCSYRQNDGTFRSQDIANCARFLREEHRVGELPWEVGQEPLKESFAGHLPIRSWKQGGYHGKTSMFYWYFPAINPKVEDPPLLIWLQGGPASSSMIGLFFENGPIRVNSNMKLERVPVSWADEYSILFIDQPVGTGYSYVTQLSDSDNSQVDNKTIKAIITKELEKEQTQEQLLFESLSDQDIYSKMATSRDQQITSNDPLYINGYVKDQRGVVADLLIFLDQFYHRYPEVQKSDLFLTGESYAGKYVPSLAYGILESNKARQLNIHEDPTQIIFPLKGVALGNTLTDPISQVQIHADHGYYMGLITYKQSEQMRILQNRAVEEAYKGRFLESNKHRLAVFDLFENSTGSLNWYDIRKGSVPNDWSRMEAFMNLDPVKNSLNIFGPRTEFLIDNNFPRNEVERIQEGRKITRYFKDPLVKEAMGRDIMKSCLWEVSSLLQQGIRVLAFQGIFDYRDAVAGSNSWIDRLDWPGQEEFLSKDRELWMNNGKLAGYVTQVEGLSRVVMLGAGHLAPMDQAENSLAMLKSLVDGTPLKHQPAVAKPATHTL